MRSKSIRGGGQEGGDVLLSLQTEQWRSAPRDTQAAFQTFTGTEGLEWTGFRRKSWLLTEELWLCYLQPWQTHQYLKLSVDGPITGPVCKWWGGCGGGRSDGDGRELGKGVH